MQCCGICQDNDASGVCGECDTDLCDVCQSTQCRGCLAYLCGACIDSCASCTTDVCNNCKWFCEYGEGCDAPYCALCIVEYAKCDACGVQLHQRTFVCPDYCDGHVDSCVTRCEDCRYLQDKFDYDSVEMARVVTLRACFATLKKWTEMAKYIPGHVGYKRLRDDWSGTYARRSERLVEKRAGSA